jgi:hypothetical protein
MPALHQEAEIEPGRAAADANYAHASPPIQQVSRFDIVLSFKRLSVKQFFLGGVASPERSASWLLLPTKRMRRVLQSRRL